MSITKITLENTSESAQQNVPFTFGQVFAKGDLPAGSFLDGLQIDAKAHHEDGSVRHAVVSGLVDLPASASRSVPLSASNVVVATPVQSTHIGAFVQITLAGEEYYAKYSGVGTTWLSGSVVTETHEAVSIKRADGFVHPHIQVRFAERAYHGTNKARIDIVVENTWAYEPNPQTFTYDVQITVDGVVVLSKQKLEHRHHSRWRKVFWAGGEPTVHLRHDPAYLISSGALPNYDQTVEVSEKALADLVDGWKGPKTEPMGVGLAKGDMPGTGGRWDIGIIPGWAAMYLLSMDYRAKIITLGTADCAGSWSMHYRDHNTQQPISLLDYPYLTLHPAASSYNYKTKKYEGFPAVAKGSTGTGHDTAHQPGFAYLPYLVTGDLYYLEELQFWAMHNIFAGNPGYRNYDAGLVYREQVRGQAWTLRTLGEAAYITPDNDRLKGHFGKVLDNNLEWYNAEYTNNPSANKLGVLVHGNAIIYKEGTALAPWQDDFFTAVIGHLADLGFKKAEPLLKWKSQFVIGRMAGEGVCWSAASNYDYTVRATSSAPVFETAGEAYRATVGEKVAALPCGETWAALGRKVGDMGGYPKEHTGFPANMQPAMAYAAQYHLGAWEKFNSRSPMTDFSRGPQFAIVPRVAEEAQGQIPPAEPTPTPPEPVEPPPPTPVETSPTQPEPIPVSTEPTLAEPVKSLVPQADDIISVIRSGVKCEVTVAALVELVSDAITKKFPILKDGAAVVEIVGKLVIK